MYAPTTHVGIDMKIKTRIWLGVGVSVVVGTAATAAVKPFAAGTAGGFRTSAPRMDAANPGTASAPLAVAQRAEPGKEA